MCSFVALSECLESPVNEHIRQFNMNRDVQYEHPRYNMFVCVFTEYLADKVSQLYEYSSNRQIEYKWKAHVKIIYPDTTIMFQIIICCQC